MELGLGLPINITEDDNMNYITEGTSEPERFYYDNKKM